MEFQQVVYVWLFIYHSIRFVVVDSVQIRSDPIGTRNLMLFYEMSQWKVFHFPKVSSLPVHDYFSGHKCDSRAWTNNVR